MGELQAQPGAASPAVTAPAVTAPAVTPAAASVERPAPLTDLLSRARGQLARGDAAAAFALLAPQVRWYGGTPEFDYLLGVAALDTGRPGEAILALERVLAVDPTHLQARAEIGRAYLAARETEAARREFESVSAQPIPPEVRALIDSYLAGIFLAERARRPRFLAFVEAGAGWDSNVNLGSVLSRWFLGGGLEVLPGPSNQPQSSPLFALAGGLSWNVPLGGGWEWTVGGQMSQRWTPSVSTLDLGSVDVVTGLSYATGCHNVSMLAQYQHLELGRGAFRDAVGGSAQWRCDVGARTQVGAYAQYFDMHYPSQDVRDAGRTLAGGTFAYAIPVPSNPILVGSAYGGDERARSDLPQLDFRFYGARAALDAPLLGGWRGSLSAWWEKRNFAGPEPLFGVTRHDDQFEVRVAVDREVAPAWVLTPQVIYTRNRSTLAPNDFERTQALVTLRYWFR